MHARSISDRGAWRGYTLHRAAARCITRVSTTGKASRSTVGLHVDNLLVEVSGVDKHQHVIFLD